MKKEKPGSKTNIKMLLADRQERIKELTCINRINSLIKESKPVEDTLDQAAELLPPAMQYPDFTVSRIIYEGKEHLSSGFRAGDHKLSQSFKTIDEHEGVIEIYYTKQFSEADEDPFLKEEYELIDNICSMLAGYMNSCKAKSLLSEVKMEAPSKHDTAGREKLFSSRKLFQQFLNRHNSERDLFHDLMPFMVKEILLVATLYDAYSIEKDGRFSDHMLGQFNQLNMASMPRVTGVSGIDEAVEELRNKHYDLVIAMVGVDKQSPVVLSRKIKEEYPYIPVFFLLNNSSDIEGFEKEPGSFDFADRMFVWNGDPKMFFAMVKLLEDHVNVDNDTTKGFTKVILLVEDSPQYYSRYLPMIYSIVLEQTKHLIEDVNTDELYKMLKLKGRPKILLASDYEDAVNIFNRYSDYILCLISDVQFPRNGRNDPCAGVELIKYVKSRINNLPILLQSADLENEKTAHELRSSFLNKNSKTLLQDLKSFITYFLGFGHFVYRDNQGRQIAVAKSMHEFESYLKTVPEESLLYHTAKNHFSLWLMASGEVQIAKKMKPLKLSDFKNADELRNYMVDMVSTYRNEQDRGKIVNFEDSAILEESNIVSFSSGSLGGKGRGLAFVNSLIYNFTLPELVEGMNIRTPVTGVIESEEFDVFLAINKLYDRIYREESYEKIKQMFINGKLSYNLEKKMKIFLKKVKRPIAIRSSSLFEDSMLQPFSGIFGTYLLPNNHKNFDVRLQQAMDAIKLVYASIFSEDARNYFETINFKIEEEKMAIVIQEVVGEPYGSYFYPHISGTAQSHNYYPVAHMKPEEGFAVAAVGLGHYVVNGEKAYRFSPVYPDLEINSSGDIYRNSQLEFYAVNLAKPEVNLLEGEDAGLIRLSISEAEKHGNLKHCASVYDPENDIITAGLDKPGPRIVNFANILKYNYMPFARTLSTILDIVKEALGGPVEIEFAVDLNRSRNNLPSFYLLQIKPLFGNERDYNIDESSIKEENIIIRSGKSMGNGMISNLKDVIYIKTENFNKMKTIEMARDINRLNGQMTGQDKKFILIGPGRWGTRDRFIGIPVSWPQISQAAVIVEMSMEGFPLDASLGSHFFHNLTSMNVGYLSVNHSDSGDFARMDVLADAEVVEDTPFARHVKFHRPLQVLMDGKKGIALVVKQDNNKEK